MTGVLPMFHNTPITKNDPTQSERIKSKNKNFTEKVKQQIFTRDNYRCIRCGTMSNLESVPHHIIYKSQGGNGDLNNGATVCKTCHILAHSEASIRKWFEDYRIKYYL